MKDLDLRQVGTIMGVPVYVDLSSIPDTQLKSFSTKYTERDEKFTIITIMIRQLFTMPPESPFGNSRVRMKKEGDDDNTQSN